MTPACAAWPARTAGTAEPTRGAGRGTTQRGRTGMTGHTFQRRRQAGLVGRLRWGARGLGDRLDGLLSRGQLGPTRDMERRDFNPARRI